MKLLFIMTKNKDKSFYEKICHLAEELDFSIAGLIDYNGGHSFTTVADYPTFPVEYIHMLSWDLAIIFTSSEYVNDFVEIAFPDFPKEKFTSYHFLLKHLMTLKYENYKDPAIQETLEYWKTHPLTVFNQHMDGVADSFDELHTDEENGLPYIWFETVEGCKKKMYYPRIGHSTIVQKADGKKYVKNILQEQTPTSPHLYMTDSHKINDGDVLIDAGVCEGNFALKYVDVCSKIYLFESDPKWLEPLYHTFKDYTKKVVFVPKYLSIFSYGNKVSLDDSVCIANKNIFLKMDIEGAEIEALRGAKSLLKNNKVKASVCSYHNPDDLWKIKSIFHKHNYKTWTSEGYMVFTWDKNIWETADFRKGIVYATN